MAGVPGAPTVNDITDIPVKPNDNHHLYMSMKGENNTRLYVYQCCLLVASIPKSTETFVLVFHKISK